MLCSSQGMEVWAVKYTVLLVNPNFTGATVFFPTDANDTVWIKPPFKWRFYRAARKACTRHISGWEFLETRKKMVPALPIILPHRTVSQMIKLLLCGKESSIVWLTQEAVKPKMPQGHMILTFWYLIGIKTQFMGGIVSVPYTVPLLVGPK